MLKRLSSQCTNKVWIQVCCIQVNASILHQGGKKHSLSALTPIQSYKPKTYVIFADSFDLSVLKIPELKGRIPNLVRLYKRSTHFNRFISISGWTFPCLHSFHTGLPPYLTFSIFRHEPTLRLGTKINEYISYQEKNARKRWNLIKQSFHFKDFPVKSEKFITRLIEENGGTTIAVKGSYNHGWYNGLTHSTHLSIENTTSVKVGDNLRSLQNILCDADFSLCLIDLDHIHKKNDFVRSSNKYYFTRPLDLLKHVQTDEDSFRGEYITSEIRQHYFNLYLDNIIEIDTALGQIFTITNENDNIVMFSDHGSDLFQLDSPYQCDNNPLSSLLPQSLKPTLLVSGLSLPELPVVVCNELVSTIDLNLLKLCGIVRCLWSIFKSSYSIRG